MGEVLRNQNNAEICSRVKEIAVENVPKHPQQGFHYEKRICSRPLVLNISENRKTCPDCEKPAPIGNVNPRTINSKDIGLTKKELEECGITDGKEPAYKEAKVEKVRQPRKPKEAKLAVEAKVSKKSKDVVLLEVPLATLEGNVDVARALIEKTIDAFGQLPVTNFAESKRLIKLEEKLRGLLEA